MILVTGVAGFIGFHTAKRLLDKGKQVVGVDNLNDYYDQNLKRARLAILSNYNNFAFVQMDLSDLSAVQNLFKKWRVNRVCHLAAQAGVRYSFENPYAYYQSNLQAFINIIETSKNARVENFVYASSSSVYGNNQKVPFAVTDRVDCPASLYAATKRANELIAYTYSQQLNLPTTGLRFFTVYGPWGRPDMAYYKFTDAIFNGRKIHVYNNGNLERDFTYIDDIVDGVIEVLDKSFSNEILNLGNSYPVSLNCFIACLEKIIGKPAQKEYLPMQTGDVYRTYADIDYTTQKILFKPRTNLEDGLEKFVRWYMDYHKTKH